MRFQIGLPSTIENKENTRPYVIREGHADNDDQNDGPICYREDDADRAAKIARKESLSIKVGAGVWLNYLEFYLTTFFLIKLPVGPAAGPAGADQPEHPADAVGQREARVEGSDRGAAHPAAVDATDGRGARRAEHPEE